MCLLCCSAKVNNMVYVLKLEQNKYYVGWSGRKDLSRIEEHFKGNGARWTTYYKPVKVIKIIPNGTLLDEEAVTIWLAFEKGLENVRGGTYAYTGKLKTFSYLPSKSIFMITMEFVLDVNSCH
jgi:predicted GIY-YIG superfamily endonuclease